MASAAHWSWFVLGGVVAACGGATVAGTGGGGADGGGSGGLVASGGPSGIDASGGIDAGGSSATGGAAGCPTGYADCNGDPSDGCETNTLSDPDNCGTCGLTCSSAGGGFVCDNGVCSVCGCPKGTGDCNHDCSDGCEIDIQNDVNNCGFCGHACSAPNATAACNQGVCSIGACDIGYVDCNSQYSDGCETNVMTDPQNCGGCGKLCPTTNGTPLCQNGNCQQMCCDQPGYADCSGNCNCVDLGKDPQNCGYCGHACASGQSCVSGSCQ